MTVKYLVLILYVLFCVFFAVGSGAITLAMLADEIGAYYRNKEILRSTEADNEKIRELISIYESQIRQIEADPNILGRFEYVTFRREPKKEGTAFPIASEGQLAEAQKILVEGTSRLSQEIVIPAWVKRCQEQRFRMSLFIAGSGLILITFIFFGSRTGKRKPGCPNNHSSFR